MITTKLLKGALAAAAAIITMTPALAAPIGTAAVAGKAVPAIATNVEQPKVQLAHTERHYNQNQYYGRHHRPAPYYAWKHKKRHNHYGWNKRQHRHWGLGYNYNRYNRGPAWR
jgi:hypothetical protein